jgi:hypothetical protein
VGKGGNLKERGGLLERRLVRIRDGNDPAPGLLSELGCEVLAEMTIADEEKAQGFLFHDAR